VPDQVIVVRWEALGEKPLIAALAAGRDDLRDGGTEVSYDDTERTIDGVSTNRVIELHTMYGTAVNGEHPGVRFAGCAAMRCDEEEPATREIVRTPTATLGKVAGTPGIGRESHAYTVVIAGATDFRAYIDPPVRLKDPRLTAQEIARAAIDRPFDELLGRHLASFTPPMERVSLDVGTSDQATKPTDVRLRELRAGAGTPRRSGRPLALLPPLPVRPLSAGLLLATGHDAGQPAGPVELPHRGALERRLPHQHQPADELLARGDREPRGVP
jgi:hypothetical protein